MEISYTYHKTKALSFSRMHGLVQVNLPIHCFSRRPPQKGRQICCKVKENYQKYLCGTNPQTLTCPTQYLETRVMLTLLGTAIVSLKYNYTMLSF